MGLNPLDTSNVIFNKYKKYITTSLKFKDKALNIQIQNLLDTDGKFAKGPIIEATPPFLQGRSIIELINDNILTEGFQSFNSESLPLDRKLYLHQEQAIIKICKDERNAIVATGTGSGKTESFIIPILNELLKEKSEGALTPGVRALLLYPMNALANDQMKRLRSLLANEPDITFGIYTGETEIYTQQAMDKYTRMHNSIPIQNELISREQMQKTPPNILLTNYAMLEYLMLRPADSVFFEGIYSNNWKFVVIDEAHTYTGAKGIEMSMLLSRLKSTIGLKKGEVRCIITSASLGSGKDDFPKVAEFGEKLFQEEFTPKDVVEASREELAKGIIWGTADPRMYKDLIKILEQNSEEDVTETLKLYGVPEDIIYKSQMDSPTYNRGVVYNVLIGDEKVNQTMDALSDGPIEFVRLAEKIFGHDLDNSKDMATLIDLCNIVRKTKNDNPIIPARYHFMVKALEGAYMIFSDDPIVYLDRMNNVDVDDIEYKAFEVGTCIKCNSIYIVGEIHEDIITGNNYLVESQNRYIEESNKLEFFVIIDEKYSFEENEDDLSEGDKIELTQETYILCVTCGSIITEGSIAPCKCKNSNYKRVIKVKSDNGNVHKCKICGATNPVGSIVRRFFLAEDTVSSVLATALYNQIPDKKIKEDTKTTEKMLFSRARNRMTGAAKKQLLVFSDSRQNAAYFSTYLNNSYKDILTKNIFSKIMNDNFDISIKNNWSLTDFHRRIESHIRDNMILNGTVETVKIEIWKWIIKEFYDKGNNSLENMGFLKFLPNYEIIPYVEDLFSLDLLIDQGLSEEEVKTLITFFIDQFRFFRAFEYPEMVSPKDSYFAPQNTQGGFCRVNPPRPFKKIPGYTIKAWRPSLEYINNSRIDYLGKILKINGRNLSKKELVELVDILFGIFTEDDSPLNNYIKSDTLNGYGPTYILDTSLFKVVPGIGNPEVKYYKCDSCHNITTLFIRGICPTYRCDGKLREINLEKELEENHYRELYSQIKLEKMDVSEHTAQLTTEYAAEIQNKFISGDINVLSCSTTFELGVDVGNLETVFMKNTPPTPANYAQRAGRAGRRTDSTAYALTFARLSSHDFNSFSDPYKMIRGIVKPPYFEIANTKIVKRHVYACAFAKFWRQYNDYFINVKKFFYNEKEKGPELFKKYLDSKPVDLKEMLLDVVPEELYDEIMIKSWGWVDELYRENGVMTKIVSELESDYESLNKAIEEAKENSEFYRAANYDKIINTLLSKNLIGFLSQKNALPKYGFPVDVVNMEVNSHIEEAKKIDLSRDLQIAISEYAPDSQIVANGKLWTSRYVKKVSKRELLRYRFESCKCGYFNKRLDIGQGNIATCPICGNSKLRSGAFIMPEFGFITDEKASDPGPTRPKKTYSSRNHFSGVGNIIEQKRIMIGDNLINVTAQNHGELTVLNTGRGRGFSICNTCGYGKVDKIPTSHKSSSGRECKGRFERVSLGYNFETDIVELDFANVFQDLNIEEGFWESLMYSIIEGVSAALEIDRSDIDGTLYTIDNSSKSLILFDTVPGGAGHVKRLMNEDQLKMALEKAYEIVEDCTCGGENRDTSCYGCLRNYYNQYCHDKMKREYAIYGLRILVAKDVLAGALN